MVALGREDEARATYKKVFLILEPEPHYGRLDWERVSILVNVGKFFSRQGDYEMANEEYSVTESLGREHIGTHEGDQIDGMGIVIVSMRARAFALKKSQKRRRRKNRPQECHRNADSAEF